jgi:hypothetical protein
LIATQQVVINILDSNDNPPSFSGQSYAVTIPEMMSVGSSVIAVSASDRDISSRLTYSVSGSGSQNFYADSIYSARTGVVRIKQVMLLLQLVVAESVAVTERKEQSQLIIIFNGNTAASM